ncbi:cell division protein FtsX [Oceanibaculum pacificum]|uniref:ABC3 transporter permease C-terminal domain-containing protein n=1 Tax=Oceanibaculum pacificum TaxID=580166 RepID=A0A154WGS1_9PROT|nr:FtsX-like permease family protein [Oceanibaculum pacificum]KZD12718.1 hypothetical protein AUP43_15395 [Oceanibaculum pacificum]
MFWRRHSDLPLRGDASSRFLPWIVAVMVFLAVLAVAGLLAAQNVVGRWQWALSGTLTVQVPPPTDAKTAATLEGRIGQIVDLLRRTPGIASATPLSEPETRALLEPWLGAGTAIEELPLPRLIDVTLIPNAGVDFAALEGRLAALAPGATLDDHGRWLGDLVRLAQSVEAVAAAIVALVALAAVAAVVFAVRTGLAIHREVIDVLHLIGARDSYIAREFARQAFTLSLLGALLGALLAGGALAVLQRMGQGLDGAPAPMAGMLSLGLEMADWILLATVPLVAILLSVITARLSVIRALSRLV